MNFIHQRICYVLEMFNFLCSPVENVKLVKQINNNYDMTWHTK